MENELWGFRLLESQKVSDENLQIRGALQWEASNSHKEGDLRGTQAICSQLASPGAPRFGSVCWVTSVRWDSWVGPALAVTAFLSSQSPVRGHLPIHPSTSETQSIVFPIQECALESSS